MDALLLHELTTLLRNEFNQDGDAAKAHCEQVARKIKAICATAFSAHLRRTAMARLDADMDMAGMH